MITGTSYSNGNITCMQVIHHLFNHNAHNIKIKYKKSTPKKVLFLIQSEMCIHPETNTLNA